MEPNELVDINAPTPEINPVPQSAPLITPHTEKAIYIAKRNSHIQPVRTFSSDLADAVREHGGSVVKIAIAENEKKQKEYQEASITSRKNIIFSTLGIILFVGAIVGGVWVYKIKTKPVEVVQTPAPQSSLVFSENNQIIDVVDASAMESASLLTSINAIVASPNIQSGTIKNIVITQNKLSISASQFLGAVRIEHAPTDFLRYLSNEYMLGTYLYNDSNLFLILKGGAHDFLLAGMLEWEPFMLTDFAPLFGIDVTGTNARLLDTKWSDVVLDNHDARAVLDTAGKPVFFYSFIDPNTILFAKNPKIITTLVSRF
jgi:hypothetical protein